MVVHRVFGPKELHAHLTSFNAEHLVRRSHKALAALDDIVEFIHREIKMDSDDTNYINIRVKSIRSPLNDLAIVLEYGH